MTEPGRVLFLIGFLLLSWTISYTRSTLMTQVYDAYTGTVLSQKQFEEHIKKNTTFWCVNEIEPCDAFEGRRFDGSCNNLEHPSQGAPHTLPHRMLPAIFDKVDKPRKSKSGDELPLSRRVRTTLLSVGRNPDPHFTHLFTYFAVFMSADVFSFHDTINYLYWTKHCCEEEGKTDSMCAGQIIPNDDPVHRFSEVRCLNLTQPFTFQSMGCADKKTTPERLITTTPFYDLSQVYNIESNNQKKNRLFKDGLLKYEEENGRIWPPSHPENLRRVVCSVNKEPIETRCHSIGEESNNGIFGTNLFTIWMWRHHNYIASELSRINPCWSDEKLYLIARDINIAISSQIFFYELNSLLLGEANLYREGILSPTLGYRDSYDKNVRPTVSLEYGVALRWMHTIQEGKANMYDMEGNYLKSIAIANLTLRTGFLAVDNHIDYITQGAFRQAAGKIDQTIDPDMADVAFGALQRATDLGTSDLAKNRLLGTAPYIWYRKLCFGDVIRSFDDLKIAITSEKIELLKELYKDVEDIDVLAGIWIEKPIPGARVPATFYCILVDQLRRNVAIDRHWYERPNRPNAFSINQLLEIRKSTIARLLCDVGDRVTRIQPRAFLRPGPGNEIQSCSEIAKIDFGAWKDLQCDKQHRFFYNNLG